MDVTSSGSNRLFDKKKCLWMLLFLLIAALTIYTVMSHSKDFTMASFRAYLSNASLPLLLLAALCAFGFIFFEGAALAVILRAFGCKVRTRRWLSYAASNIYFSAITPSATGGQPACAYFMIKDGLPASVTAISLLLNLTLYTFSILLIGLVVIIAHPAVFAALGIVSKILVLIGSLIQVVLAAFFMMLLINCDLLHRICRTLLHFLCRIHLVRHEVKKQQKLDRYIDEYREYSEMILQRKKALFTAFLLNIAQRTSVILVSVFVFLSGGGQFSQAFQVFSIQTCTIVGSNPIPIPGAMGVSDYIMLDGFGKIMPYASAVHLELISRSLSFYISVILCGLTVLIKYLLMKHHQNRKMQAA